MLLFQDPYGSRSLRFKTDPLAPPSLAFTALVCFRMLIYEIRAYSSGNTCHESNISRNTIANSRVNDVYSWLQSFEFQWHHAKNMTSSWTAAKICCELQTAHDTNLSTEWYSFDPSGMSITFFRKFWIDQAVEKIASDNWNMSPFGSAIQYIIGNATATRNGHIPLDVLTSNWNILSASWGNYTRRMLLKLKLQFILKNDNRWMLISSLKILPITFHQ